MKKQLFLVLAAASIFGACKKDSTLNTSKKAFPKDGLVSVGGGGGGGASIAYNPTTGKYEATYYGAQLEFWPIPNNTNFKDGDIADVNITCLNCTSFTAASAGYFVGAIPIISASAIQNIHKKIKDFNQDFSDHINGVKKSDGSLEFKVPVMPVFPESGGDWEQSFSGVVVRTHSSASTITIAPSTFKVNPPNAPSNEGTIDIGGFNANGIYYSITINAVTKRITDVSGLETATGQLISGLSFSGASTSQYNNKVTARIIKDGEIVVDVVDQLVQ